MGIAIGNLVCSCLLLLLTALSVRYAYKAYQNQKQRALKDKAIELSKYYADVILPLASYISLIMESSGLEMRTKELFPFKKIHDFDRDEIESLLASKSESFDAIDEEFFNCNTSSIFRAKVMFQTDDSKKEEILAFYSKGLSDDESKKFIEPFLINEYQGAIADLLNYLEYFSMNFKYGLADEELVYQSLHQTYISTVWTLYFYIASKNVDNENKYFTNIIDLYILWETRARKRHEEQKKKLKESKLEPYCGNPLL